MNEHPAAPPADVLVVVARRWRLVALFTMIGAAAGVAYALLSPVWYQATLSVVPPFRSQDAALASIASKLPLPVDVASDVQRIEAVLTSTSVVDEVITRFDLEERYGVEHREHAREALREHCPTTVDRNAGVVTLTCEDKDPRVAMELAAAFGEIGDRVFGRVSASSAREERKFLESQLAQARQDVGAASERLRAFQEKHKIIDLPEQSKAVISAMAGIQGELLSKQLELSYLSTFSSKTEPGVVQKRQQIAILQSKLGQLEAKREGAASAQDPESQFFPVAGQVPSLRLELEQLLREQKIREDVLLLITQRYELARVEEARDTSSFHILDSPTLPTHKSRPKRAQVTLFGLAAGFACSLAWILLPAWWRQRAGTFST